MGKREDESYKLSYESDGKMGKKEKEKNKKKETVEFFNVTQDSE